jgi:hypothetical protein
MAIRKNNAEGGTVGTAPVNGQAGSGDSFDTVFVSGGGAIVYANNTAQHGSKSYFITATAAGGDAAYLEFNGLDAATVSTRCYLWTALAPTTGVRVINMQSGPVTNAASITLLANMRPAVTNAAGGVVSTNITPLRPNTWYRLEYVVTRATATTGSCTFAVYEGDGTIAVETPFTTTTANFGTANISRVSFGKTTTTGALTSLYYDDIAIDDTTSALLGGYSPTAPTAWLRA